MTNNALQRLPLQPASADIWDKKYRLKNKAGQPLDKTVDDTYKRVARALADIEPEGQREKWYEEFLAAMRGGVIPAGRITSNAGAQEHKPETSLINCLAGDTPILTRQGVRAIRELVGTPVEVLNGAGNWVQVEFHSYGIQATVEALFRNAGRKKESALRVRSTLNHRWILDSGRVVTTEYWATSPRMARDHHTLPNVFAPRPERNEDYARGVFHGMVYGDGSRHTGTDHYVLDLVGEKRELAVWAEGVLGKSGLETAYSNKGASGPTGLRWNFTDHGMGWKELPSPKASPSYVLGFMAGLLATDGSVSPLAGGSCNLAIFGRPETVGYVASMAPTVGIVPYAPSVASARGSKNNYGIRSQDLCRIGLNASSVDPADVLRSRHKEAYATTGYGMGTVSKWNMLEIVANSIRNEEVFCCQEPETGAFVLASGLLTGNCTVSGHIQDHMDDIMRKAHEAALTLKAGCGIGYSFSTLRPRGAFVAGAGAYTSGPLSFMDIYDSTCFTVASAGGRRGAQMGTFDVSHPDVREFIKAKREDGRLRQFNLSLLITDEFVRAVESNQDWALVFPVHRKEADELDLTDPTQVVWREWPIKDGYIGREDGLVACKIYDHLPARRLWDLIMSSTYDYAEPGFILIDRVNEMNNNWWCENIQATNPCVAGHTLVLTDRGWVRIDSLEGQQVRVWNGREFSQVLVEVTGHDQEMLLLTFSNGSVLECTLYHGFHLDDGRKVEAKDLVVGMDLEPFSLEPGGPEHRVRVVSTEVLPDRAAKVYCFNEPLRHRGCFNGIVTANCGEQPLPEYGSCLLGSVNLTRFVRDPFTEHASFDWDAYRNTVQVFTRMLDNVVEINGLPLERQREEIFSKRRHGMGYLGLGSALTMMGIPYGSQKAVGMTEELTKVMAIEGWRQALVLAKEKGPAPLLAREFTVNAEMLRKRPEMVRDGWKAGDSIRGSVLHARYSRYMQRIAEVEPELVKELAEVGARFTHHSSIAPTGTIALSLANNASNGIEPSFAHHYSRNVIREGRKTKEKVEVYSYELLAYRELVNPAALPFSEDPATRLPEYFVSADDITPIQHVDIQAAAQKWIDSSISKTANVPTDFPYEKFKDIYLYAYHNGLKGCTTFRFNPAVFQGVLVKEKDLENTTYEFTLADGSVVSFRGNEMVEYDGESHTAANLFDALKEGYYGKF